MFYEDNEIEQLMNEPGSAPEYAEDAQNLIKHLQGYYDPLEEGAARKELLIRYELRDLPHKIDPGLHRFDWNIRQILGLPPKVIEGGLSGHSTQN